MAEIVKINSKKGLVLLTQKDIAENDLAPWIRTNSKGLGHYSFVNQQPFERVAAKLFVEKYPSTHVKVAENIVCTKEGGVDVFLRITDDLSRGNYNTHPTKLVFNKGKETVIEDIAKHGFDIYPLEKKAEEALAAEYGLEEDSKEEFYKEIGEFLDDIKNLSEDDLVEKISPEELEDISKMLDLDSDTGEDFEEGDPEGVELEDDFEGEDDDIGTHGNDDDDFEGGNSHDSDDNFDDNFDYVDLAIDDDRDPDAHDSKEDVLKTVNLDDFSEDKSPKVIEISGEVPAVDDNHSDNKLREIIKEILG